MLHTHHSDKQWTSSNARRQTRSLWDFTAVIAHCAPSSRDSGDAKITDATPSVTPNRTQNAHQVIYDTVCKYYSRTIFHAIYAQYTARLITIDLEFMASFNAQCYQRDSTSDRPLHTRKGSRLYSQRRSSVVMSLARFTSTAFTPMSLQCLTWSAISDFRGLMTRAMCGEDAGDVCMMQ